MIDLSKDKSSFSHRPIFITGTGTGIGKTVVSAIVAEALQADYWKPVQAGYENGTDSEWVRNNLTNKRSVIHPEAFRLRMAASPHIASREEGIDIEIQKIVEWLPQNCCNLIIEGPGGILVPFNEKEFVIDLIKAIDAMVILVTRNYLGSINHSLLTARTCHEYNLDVIGWIFNDKYLDYENEIVKWTGFAKIGSIPYCENINGAFIADQAAVIRERLATYLC